MEDEVKGDEDTVVLTREELVEMYDDNSQDPS